MVTEFVFLAALCGGTPGAEVNCTAYEHMASFYHEIPSEAQGMCLEMVKSMRARNGLYQGSGTHRRVLRLVCIDEKQVP